MTNLKEARKEAKEANIQIGKLTSRKDSMGEYTLYEDSVIVAEGFFNTASEIKCDYIENKLNNVGGGW